MLTGRTSNWVLVALLVVITAIVAAWVVTGHYVRTERVVGTIVTNGGLSRVIPTRPGTVVQLGVKEGDQVTAGQPLATIRVEEASADRSDPAAEDLASMDRQHRLIEQQIGLSRLSQADAEAKQSAEISQYRQELTSLAVQLEHQARLVQSAKDTFETLTGLLDKGFVSRTQFEQRRQSYLSAQIELGSLESQRAQTEGELKQAQVALADIPTQTAQKINDLVTSEATLLQRRIEVESASRYVVTAAVPGRISSLQVSVGSSVSAALPLMSIVGPHAQMMADLYAPSRAIGFARPGQEVRLMYDAFPSGRFGTFKGTIAAISQTVLAPKDVDAPIELREPVYRIRVALADQTVSAFGENVPLQPGMTLNANIVLDRRSFLDWLLEPIRAVRSRA